MKVKNLILGAGISGLSQSYFMGHRDCLLLERKSYIGGHCSSKSFGSVTWDEGPHVSFTKNETVLSIFKESVEHKYEALDIKVGNYWRGNWVPHPIQMYLSYLPEDIRDRCVSEFLKIRARSHNTTEYSNYGEWLTFNFGEAIKASFIDQYTMKYWRCTSENLSTDWLGPRVKVPSTDELILGASERVKEKHHYVSSAIYPTSGGFQRFLDLFSFGANVLLDTEIEAIDLGSKAVCLSSGAMINYDRLISTIPLPIFMSYLRDVPSSIMDEVEKLKCTSLSIVNVLTDKRPIHDLHWFYVYDQEMLSTRITQQHMLSANNAPTDTFAYQVEVYHPPSEMPNSVSLVAKVIDECREMGLLDNVLSSHYQYVKYANVVPDLNRRIALERIFDFLTLHGLRREAEDTSPIHAHSKFDPHTVEGADIFFVGRYAQWTYGWTDDCVVRACNLADAIR